MRRSIIRDTVLLTVMQMTLDALSLGVNVLLTRELGAAGVGVLTLCASFFRLACMIGSGNVFLCVSRFVSEELGRTPRDPVRVLGLCLGVSVTLSLLCMGLLCAAAPSAAGYFLHDTTLSAPIRRMALALPLLTLAACLKGWYNALCKAGICAAADGIEFLLRTGGMLAGVLLRHPDDPAALCTLTADTAVLAGGGELLFLLLCLPLTKTPKTGASLLTLRRYLGLAVPVMAGSALTALLSAANDALVPVTLRQAGNSANEALAQFGIFEAMILPTLFFPSTILCALAGILVTETAREKAADRQARIQSLTAQTIQQTLRFAVFVTMLLLLFGDALGERLGGGEIAGRMIRLLAPVVPFIYLEIVLESIIKGLGAQAFSSLNYLCEYIIRISLVLVCIPLMGFYGIVLSYYASNIVGNTARLIVVLRKTALPPRPFEWLGLPLFAAVLSSQVSRAVFLLPGIEPAGSITGMMLFTLLCGSVYLGILKILRKPGEKIRTKLDNPACFGYNDSYNLK